MRLFGILFSCVCLQLASGPAAQAFYPEGEAQQLDPGQESGSKIAVSVARCEAASLALVPQFSAAMLFLGSAHLFEKSFSFGPKEFFIRTGLSPPSLIG